MVGREFLDEACRLLNVTDPKKMIDDLDADLPERRDGEEIIGTIDRDEALAFWLVGYFVMDNKDTAQQVGLGRMDADMAALVIEINEAIMGQLVQALEASLEKRYPGIMLNETLSLRRGFLITNAPLPEKA